MKAHHDGEQYMAHGSTGTTAFNVAPRFFTALAIAALTACGGGGGATAEPTAAASDTPAASSPAPTAVELKAKRFAGPGLIAHDAALVNTATAGNQALRIAGALTGGGYSVVWISTDGASTTTGAHLLMQRYDAAGARSGSETQVAFDFGTQTIPAIAVLPDGALMVSHVSSQVPASDPSALQWQVHAQRFDTNGAATGADTVVASFTEHPAGASVRYSLAAPEVLAWKDGSYAVAWASAQEDYRGKVQAFHLQRFDVQGRTSGATFDFGNGGIDQNLSLKLIATDAGKFIAGITHRFQGQLYAIFNVEGGAAIGPLYDAQLGLPAQESRLVPLADGRLALWSRNASGPYLRVHDAAGNMTGAATAIASLPESAVALNDGGYATFSRTAQSDPLVAQRFDSALAAVGDPIQIATGGAVPSMTRLFGAGVALAWTAPSAAGDTDVMAQKIEEADLTKK
jgi:hypothetical protein